MTCTDIKSYFQNIDSIYEHFCEKECNRYVWTELFILGTDTSLQTTRIYAENELANHNERIRLTDDWKQLIDLYDAIFF